MATKQSYAMIFAACSRGGLLPAITSVDQQAAERSRDALMLLLRQWATRVAAISLFSHAEPSPRTA